MGSLRLAAAAQQPGSAAVLTAKPCLTNPAAAIPLRPSFPPVLQQVQDERKDRERDGPAAAISTFPPVLQQVQDERKDREWDCPAAAIPLRPILPPVLQQVQDERKNRERNCSAAAIPTFPLILNLLKDEYPAMEQDCPAVTADQSPRYDYLLVVGPGRSGSDFLYRQLQAHPQLAFPEIKEGYYYRSIRRYRKFRSPQAGAGLILSDIANLAYQDPDLPGGVARLQADGARILLVVLLRQHWDRAVSMLAFRQSRGEYPLGRNGQQRLAAAVLRDRLTPEQLSRLYQMDTDVLTIHFPALVGNPAGTLAALAAVCGIDNFPPPQVGVVNPAANARNFLLARLGRFAARSMRRVGLRRALQRVKDNPRLMNLFFRPRPPAEPPPELPAASRDCLEQAYRECCALVAAAPAEKIAAGVYFRRAAAAAAAAPLAESGGPP